MTIDQIAAKFNIPDLPGALADYLINRDIAHVSGRHLHGDHTVLPFTAVEVWTKVQIQNCTYHAPHNIIPAQMANALPPSTTWQSGHADTVLINVNSDYVWPQSGLNSMMIFDFCHVNSFQV